MGRRKKVPGPDYGREGGYGKPGVGDPPQPMTGYLNFNPWNNSAPVPASNHYNFNPRLTGGGAGSSIPDHSLVSVCVAPTPSTVGDASSSWSGSSSYFNYPSTAKFGRRSARIPSVGQFKCSYCPATFTAQASARRHEVAHSNNAKPFSCDVCGQRFTQSYTVVLHKQKLHSGLPRRGRLPGVGFQCPECPATFQKSRQFQRHIKREHRPQEPRNAPRKAPSEALPRRIQGKKVTPEFFCKICPMSFAKSERFKEHMKYHSKWVEEHKVGHVRSAYRITARLRQIFERLPRTAQAPLRAKYLKRFDSTIELPKCDVCGWLSSCRATQRLHVTRVHVQAQPGAGPLPTCKYCGGKFKANEFLRRHIAEVHLKLHRFESRYCPRVFHQRRSMQRHNWAHERLGVCQQPTPYWQVKAARRLASDPARDCELCGRNCPGFVQFVHHFEQCHERKCSVDIQRLKMNPVPDSDPEVSSGSCVLCPTCGNWFKTAEFRIHLEITPKTCGNGQDYRADFDFGTTDSLPEPEPEIDFDPFEGVVSLVETAGTPTPPSRTRAKSAKFNNDESDEYDKDNNEDAFDHFDVDAKDDNLLGSGPESPGNCWEMDFECGGEPGRTHADTDNEWEAEANDSKDFIESPEPMLDLEIKTELPENPDFEPQSDSSQYEEKHEPISVRVKRQRACKKYVRCPRPRPLTPPVQDMSTSAKWKELEDGRIRCARADCQREFGPKPGRVLYAKKTHYNVHHGEETEKAFVCHHCGVQLANRYTYMSHVRLHTGERPYACDLCPAKFPSNPYLFQHKRDVHEKRTYQCSICGKVNKYYVNHTTHMRKHRLDAAAEAEMGLQPQTELSASTCPHCGKQFVHVRRLRSHLVNVHGTQQQQPGTVDARAGGALVRTCDKCPKIFSSLTALKRHRLVEHPANGVKPVFFQCKLCERGFGLISTMRSHLRKAHATELWPPELLVHNSFTVTAPAPGAAGGDWPKTYSLESYFIRNKWSSFK